MTQTLQKSSIDAAGPFLEKFSRFESGAKSPMLPFRKAGLALFQRTRFPNVKGRGLALHQCRPAHKVAVSAHV